MSLLDDVGVLEALQEGDLSNCGTWDSIVFLLKADFLQGNNLTARLGLETTNIQPQ